MRTILSITKALNDQTRLRMLLVLAHGELCLCQLVELFGLAPSTISKHLNILYDSNLVTRRREGKWAYFGLVGRGASPEVKRAIRFVSEGLKGDPQVFQDEKRLKKVLKKDLKELCGCYS